MFLGAIDLVNFLPASHLKPVIISIDEMGLLKKQIMDLPFSYSLSNSAF
jgi:hypothetical protein